tara:strand:+ start:1568 stop:2065 length:498 start_codon:yes stop_codon:yes gene_type:complete
LFYKKAKPETIKKRKEEYAELYKEEIKWLSTNDLIKGNNFLLDMLLILKTGKRPFSEKMLGAVRKAMKDPRYDVVEGIKRKEKIRPILDKVNVLYDLVEEIDSNKSSYYQQNYSSLNFVKSLKKQLETRMSLTEKQMLALNKVFKRYNKQMENMLKKSEKNEKKA